MGGGGEGRPLSDPDRPHRLLAWRQDSSPSLLMSSKPHLQNGALDWDVPTEPVGKLRQRGAAHTDAAWGPSASRRSFPGLSSSSVKWAQEHRRSWGPLTGLPDPTAPQLWAGLVQTHPELRRGGEGWVGDRGTSLTTPQCSPSSLTRKPQPGEGKQRAQFAQPGHLPGKL